MVSIYFDPNFSAIFVGGSSTVFPPGSLSAIINANGQIEVWTGARVTRVVGPIPFDWITNQSGNAFPNALAALAYLQGQFALEASLALDGGAI